MWALALAAVVLTSCVVLLRRSKTKAARRPSDTLKETVETLAEEIEKPQLKCAMCGMDDGHVYGGLRRCGRCKTTWYCTAECQRAHWPAHRCNCEAIAARGGLKLLTASGKAAQVAVDAAKAYLALPPSLRAWSLRPEAAAMREDSRFVKTGNALLDASCGGAQAKIRDVVDAEARSFWPDAVAWGALLDVAPCDVLFQQPPAAAALLAHVCDLAFDGAFGASAPRPAGLEVGSPAALYDHAYFPDFRDPTPDVVARVVADAVGKGWLAADARVLEVGVGTGAFCRALHRRLPNHALTLDGLNGTSDDDDRDLAVARAHGASSRLPWFGLASDAPPGRAGYARLESVDVADVAAVRALDLGSYDAIVSVSTFFLVGFPDRSGPPPAGEPVLGLAALEALVAACLKPDGLVCVATASSPRGGHPARAAVETLASGDYEVLRAGAGAAVGMPHKIYDLRFYGTSKDLELSALAAEAKMLMEMGAIKPSPGDETTAYSALDAEDTQAPFSVNDPPPSAVASAMEYIMHSPWPRIFVDGGLNSPFWLLKRDAAAAEARRADSPRHAPGGDADAAPAAAPAAEPKALSTFGEAMFHRTSAPALE